jgi:hypothetical protein
MTRSFALFTKTYVGDRDCFAQLCASIDRHMPDVTHYVLVDHSDFSTFAHYQSDRRKVIDCKTILPQFTEINLPGRRIWWKFPSIPVRGWIYQQLIKIGFSATLEEDVVVVVDSDVTFRRALTSDELFVGDRVKLYRVTEGGDGPQWDQWHRIAQRCLGVPEKGYSGFDYIHPVLPISPKMMRAMIARIEEVTGKNWAVALCGNFRFSEYILYGNFCDNVEGPHQELVHPVAHGFCHCHYAFDLNTDPGIDGFVKSFSDQYASVLVQSNLGLPEEKRNAILARFESQDIDRPKSYESGQ